MGIGQVGALRQLRALFASGTATGLTDKELLERYTAKRTESAEAAAAAEMAFAALVDRHGAMVWGVCHRVLGDPHEAEDAFQATFLILVRKASSVSVDGSLGRWLYGVAHRVALRARSDAEQRLSVVEGVAIESSDDPASEAERSELCAVVGEEVNGLPIKYRSAVELCHLQGMTYDQAAQLLDWPVATVKNRLTKGRLRLRARLVRRGVAPGAVTVGVTTVLTDRARAAIPQELVQSTARAASAGTAGAFETAVIQLSHGVLRMMMLEKLKLASLGVLFAAGVSALGFWQQAANGRTQAAAPRPRTAVRPVEEADENSVRDGRWTRSLASGATIEVLGISSLPAGPDTWRRPDGTRFKPAPRDAIANRFRADNAIRRLVTVRLSKIPEQADHQWSINEARSAMHRPTTRDGERVTGLYETVVSLPADARTCTVRFKVASGPWVTIHTAEKNTSGGGTQFGGSYIVGNAFAIANGTSLSVIHNFQHHSVRLVAVDDQGKSHAGSLGGTIDVTDFRQLTFQFDVALTQIKDFRLEVRPHEQVEIPGIALERN